jgi:pimeloyl-ACP methyl ester carboxylesterase
LASFARLIRFDKRGTGLSDRVADVPTLDQRMDDVRAVMDAAGSERAVLLGVSEGGPMSVLFAATYPERTIALILYGAMVKGTWAPDYPWAPTPEQNEAYFKRLLDHWGTEVPVFDSAPSAANDPALSRWIARFARMSASPGGVVALERMNADIDVRHVLPSIRVPALVLHRTGDRVLNVGEGRYLAAHIPGARYVELPGDDHAMFAGDQGAILDEIEAFVASVQTGVEPDTVLATVLCAAAEPPGGIERLREIARHELAAYRGREARLPGETILATFDGPSRAVRCAEAIRTAAAARGITVRAALHTGEVELRGDAVGGAPVQIAEQLAAAAGADEVLVSSTVTHLVAGSGFTFVARDAAVAGIPDDLRLFALARVRQ